MTTIVIDPGHYGGYNSGVCPDYYEGNTMLKLANYLGPELERMGATVKYTRTSDDQNPTLQQRGQMGANADLFISLHTDASDNTAASGVTSFYSVRQPETRPFAVEIGEAVADAMGNSFREAVARQSETTPGFDYLGVLRSAVAAGAKNAFLIEHGFHTNLQDCQTLSDDSALQRIAAAEAAAIGRHFNLSAPVPASVPVSEAGSGNCRFRYTVQEGESLYSIGQKFGIPWQNIAAANRIPAPYRVMPGQSLVIPVAHISAQYLVRPGESLYTIGRKFGIPWTSIASANNLLAPYTIRAGQRLTIPQPCAFLYTAQPGDSLYTIGMRFGVPWEDIADANDLFYPYRIFVGETLIIPYI